MHATHDNMPTSMKSGCALCVSKMRRGEEEERREAETEIHFRAEDGRDSSAETSTIQL